MAIKGIPMSSIGETYDIGIGYPDPSSGDVLMRGYVISPDPQNPSFSESSDIQNNQRLVQIGQTNATDRYAYYPLTSQGDWSGGEGQEYLQQTDQYYQSFKVDTTKPVALQLEVASRTITVTNVGVDPMAPFATDGLNPAVGVADSTNAIGQFLDVSGARWTLSATGGQPMDAFIGPSLGAFWALADGIWQVPPPVPQAGPGTAGTRWTTEVIDSHATQAMTYVPGPEGAGGTGGIYYARSDNTIRRMWSSSSGSVTMFTGYTMLQPIRFLCAGATGLIFACQGQRRIGNPQSACHLFSFDGVTATHLFEFNGLIRAGHTMNGITYLLLQYQQSNLTLIGEQNYNTAPQFTLVELVGGQINVIYDQRFVQPDFRSSNVTALAEDYGASLYGDGRFLYIGWPGMYPLAYDSLTRGIRRVGGAVVPAGIASNAHRVFYTTQHGVVDVISTFGLNANSTVIMQFSDQVRDTGYLISSWIDASAPTTTKTFRAVVVDLAAAMPAGASIVVDYRLDNQTAWSHTTLVRFTTSNGRMVFAMPETAHGERMQYRITLNAGSGVSPVVRDIGVKATAGRVWKVVLACRRSQRTRRGSPDTQCSSQELLANLQNARELCGGEVVLYVPDATVASGVAQVNASIEKYDRVVSSAPGRTVLESGAPGMEGDVSVTLVELP